MITSEKSRNILNFILFQMGWFSCVLFPALVGPVLVAAILVAHFVLVSQQRLAELQFIVLGTVVGTLLDGLWFRIGVLDVGTGTVLFTPVWLIAIWLVFMTSLSHSLDWISRKTWLPFVFAPIGGPFAYWSASKLGIVELPELLPSLVALAIGWLIVFPLLLWARKSFYPELMA